MEEIEAAKKVLESAIELGLKAGVYSRQDTVHINDAFELLDNISSDYKMMVAKLTEDKDAGKQ
jgi:tRNA(Phe) wybutosine-synthesizing methylase Tyw3